MRARVFRPKGFDIFKKSPFLDLIKKCFQIFDLCWTEYSRKTGKLVKSKLTKIIRTSIRLKMVKIGFRFIILYVLNLSANVLVEKDSKKINLEKNLK